MSRTLPRAYVTAAWSSNRFEAEEEARKYCQVLVKHGYIPICPVLAFSGIFAEENADAHKLQKEMEEDLLRRARLLVVCGNRINEEVKDDITIAKKAKLIVTSMEGIICYM
ncbi:MAG: hypothetical protein IJD96_06700 [Lachnospiraceae bacterium]|nr:hypothetical protein [Lachnospiraceae bacterium]